jgi:hypothetical protein
MDWAIDRLGKDRIKEPMHIKICWIGLEFWHWVPISLWKTSVHLKPSMRLLPEKFPVTVHPSFSTQ